MASNNGVNMTFRINLSPAAQSYFATFPAKLKKARREAVEVAGMVWSDETKAITREEDHIDTSLYINSIGYSTGSPSDPKWDLSEGSDKTKLTVGVGSSVHYAEHLEKRYNLMARGLDRAKSRIGDQVANAVRRNLDL